MVILDHISSRLLEELSQNSRQSFSGLGRKLGVTGATIARRLKKLEKEYGLKYVLEIDQEALGLTANYVMFAKFKKVPPVNELKRIFEKYPETQYAALTKGDFDLFVYGTSSDPGNFSRWVHWILQELNEYLEYWGITNVVGNWFGFIPLRDKFIDTLDIKEPKKTLLKLLNKNARTPLKKLAKEVGLSMSTTQYHLKQLMKARYVKRFTMIVTKPSKDVHLIFMWKYAIPPDYMKHAIKARKALKESETPGVTNSLIIATNTIGATDDIVIEVFNTIKEAQEFDVRLRNAFGPVIIEHRSAFIVEDVLGNLPARNMDVHKEYYGKWKVYDYLNK